MNDELEKIEKLIWLNNHLTLKQLERLQGVAEDLINEVRHTELETEKQALLC